MSAESAKAAAVTPPVAAAQNVIVRSAVTSAERIQIPDAWRKAGITIQADGADVYVLLGDSTVAADSTATSTLTSEEVTAYDGGECVKIPDGSERYCDLSQIDRHGQAIYLSHIASATGGYVRVWRSTGKA